MMQNQPKWKCESCGRYVIELSYCPSCWKMVCSDCYDPYVGVCTNCVAEILYFVHPVSTTSNSADWCVDKQMVKAPKRNGKAFQRFLFFHSKTDETLWTKCEENFRSLHNARCCEHQFFKHDKVRGEIFCVNCGTIIVQRTFGQGGRKGADRVAP